MTEYQKPKYQHDDSDQLPAGFSIETNDPNIGYFFKAPRASRVVNHGNPVKSLGKLWFYEAGRNPSIFQVGHFKETIVITIEKSEIPNSDRNAYLCYEDPISNNWVFFERQYRTGEGNLIVEFNFWHPDPALGWGFE